MKTCGSVAPVDASGTSQAVMQLTRSWSTYGLPELVHRDVRRMRSWAMGDTRDETDSFEAITPSLLKGFRQGSVVLVWGDEQVERGGAAGHLHLAGHLVGVGLGGGARCRHRHKRESIRPRTSNAWHRRGPLSLQELEVSRSTPWRERK